jgi:hypothetical protein
MGYETILVERPNPRIVRIVMSRHEARNVQNLQATVVSKKGVNQSSRQQPPVFMDCGLAPSARPGMTRGET